MTNTYVSDAEAKEWDRPSRLIEDGFLDRCLATRAALLEAIEKMHDVFYEDLKSCSSDLVDAIKLTAERIRKGEA